MTVAVGLVGAGGIGETHAEQLHATEGATVEGICDLDPERARALAGAVGAQAYTDYRELFEGEPLDAVYVATPPRTHAAVVTAAARRGLGIFCEKPLAATLEDGRAIADAVEAGGVPFMMGFCLRFCEPCRRLHELVAGGRVGDPVLAFSSRAGQGVPEGDDWRIDPEQACGIAVESASHNLDLLRWLGGEVAAASGLTTNVSHPELSGFDDNVVATLAYESGAIGLVQNSWTSAIEYLRHGVIGTEGAAVVEGDGWWRLDRLVRATGDGEETVRFGEETATAMGYRAETRAFVGAVAADDPPPVGVGDGLRALELSHAIRS